jgi:RHS repeat-associated protein
MNRAIHIAVLHPLRGEDRQRADGAPTQNTSYLDYMHARYYEPTVGRFFSVDPGAG